MKAYGGIHNHRQWIWIPGSLAEPVIGPAEGRTRWLGLRNDDAEIGANQPKSPLGAARWPRSSVSAISPRWSPPCSWPGPGVGVDRIVDRSVRRLGSAHALAGSLLSYSLAAASPVALADT